MIRFRAVYLLDNISAGCANTVL